MAASIKYTSQLLSRLRPVFNVTQCSSFHTCAGPQFFRYTSPLSAEPMKKRKRVDASVVYAKTQKKKKKLERFIMQLKLKDRNLKPVEEVETDRQLLKTLDTRKRETKQLTFDECEERALLMKDWTRYKTQHHRLEVKEIRIAMAQQQKALDELRKESEELYQMAIQIDDNLLPYTIEGPTNTPPIKGYYSPDGEYIDITPTFDKLAMDVDISQFK